MYFGQFKRSLSGIVESTKCYGQKIDQHEDGSIYIDNEKTNFSSLEEARSHIKQTHYATHLEEQVKKEIYEELSENKIADIISKYHDTKITDTLIESYIDLASSKLFSLDPVVEEIRKLNKFETIVENKHLFKLEDGSMVAVSKQTHQTLKDLFSAHNDVIDHMRQTKENFVKVIKQLGD